MLKLQRKAQEVIVAACVKNSYQIVKLLYADGYKIFEKFGNEKEFYPDGKGYFHTQGVGAICTRVLGTSRGRNNLTAS